MTIHLLWVLSTLCFFQGEGTRGIIPEEFIKARPEKPGTTAAGKEIYKPAVKTVRPGKSLGVQGATFAQLGLTIWRLRPASATDSGARIIVHEEKKKMEWTPERLNGETPLRVGDRLRFSFESPRKGYLYVIDREQYSDGTEGEPYLIFPTTRTRNGENQVSGGRIVEVPGQEDQPNYFTLHRTRPDQTGELLTVLVAGEPLEGISIGPKALKLERLRVSQWEKEWGGPTERFEMAGGTGKTWTKVEQIAGADASHLLTQEDPGPQTIYRVTTKLSAPILVRLSLRYGKPEADHKR